MKFGTVVVQTTPPGIHHLKWGLYLIYAVLNALFVPLVYYLVVETRGRSLEETDRWFEENPGWLVHKADHAVKGRMGEGEGLALGRLGKLRVDTGADGDREAMMGDFELGSDEEESPVTRRSSYPLDGEGTGYS